MIEEAYYKDDEAQQRLTKGSNSEEAQNKEEEDFIFTENKEVYNNTYKMASAIHITIEDTYNTVKAYCT